MLSQKISIVAAAREGQTKILKGLLRRGTDPNAQDDCSRTALLEASSSGHLDCVEVLLKAGADIDAKGPGGNTPLMRATTSGNWRIVEKLLIAGASPHVTNNEGLTAFEVAQQKWEIVASTELADASQGKKSPPDSPKSNLTESTDSMELKSYGSFSSANTPLRIDSKNRIRKVDGVLHAPPQLIRLASGRSQ